MSSVAGPSRLPAQTARGKDTWQPTRYLEPNHPDNEEVLEQAAYQAAVTRLGGDNRGTRKYKPRRTVDFMGPVVKWRQMTKLKGVDALTPAIHPNPSDLVGLLPPLAHRLNPSTSVCDHFVHTSINKERSPTRVVKWTPDARRLLTGNDKGQFTLWNGASFNYESITQVHDDSIRHFCYSHNGQALVSADKSGTIKYFTPHLTNIHGFQGHREACHGVSWSPNDERFVTAGDDGLVKIWDYREAKEERALSGHGWDVRCVDWHPSKGLVVSGSKDMLVKFWDPRTGKDLSTLHSHKSTINTLSFSPSGHLLASAGSDTHVRLFDIRTFRELDPLKSHTKEVNCLEWHPIHHNLLCSGDAAGAIIYWSLLAPDPSVPVTKLDAAHEEAVFSLAFHPLGHILCSGSKDFTARFWCRARPMGGQEEDRWHLGEERALGAKIEAEREAKRLKAEGNGEGAGAGAGGVLPGLPGLARLNAAVHDVLDGAKPLPQPYGGLPGIGGGLPGLGGGGASGPPPPMRSWQATPMDAPPAMAGGYAGRAPLPSQDEMIRRGPPGGDRERNGARQPPGGYGGAGGAGGGYGAPALPPPGQGPGGYPAQGGYGPAYGPPSGGQAGYPPPPTGGQGGYPPAPGYNNQNGGAYGGPGGGYGSQQGGGGGGGNGGGWR